jgi:hypothetical protein
VKRALQRFVLGIGDRLGFLAQAQSGRSLYRLCVAAILSVILPAPAPCQLALPEFFGFYAADHGRTVALFEGKGSADTTRITQDLYSIPRKAPQSYTVPVVSSSARFLLFYQNSGEMIKAMTFHRLPLVRNVIETPDPATAATFTGRPPVGPRVIGNPNKPLLARIPELEARILTKPVPNQLQMVELVPNATLEPGLYVFDYSPSPNQGWHAVISIRSSDQEKPYCLDLMLPGGYGGLFESANSELNDAVPALGSYRYKACDGSTASNTSVPPTVNPSGGSASGGGTGGESDLTSAWDNALSLGQSAAIGLCRARGGFIVRNCEQGTLSLGLREVSFSLSNGQKLFAVPPSQVQIKKDSILVGVFLIDVGGKASRFQYSPPGVDCPDRMEAFAACPPKGVAQQVAVADYVAQAIRKLAAGSFGAAPQQ